MATTILDETTLRDIRGRFAGEVLEPGDDGYDEARSIFNGLFDRRPRVILRCTGAADVVAAVGLARETGLPLAVRGGGHGVGGHAVCDDGIMLDLSPMKAIDVDPDARTARAEAGVTWGELDAATQEHGLATTGGRVTHTGIAGFTLGAGSGWLERLHGYTADNLLAAEVVTASGEVLRASEEENAELFWGLRGGDGNFGVVTSCELRLHEVGPIVVGGLLLWPLDRAPEVLRAYRDFIEAAPDEVGGGAAFLTAPPEPFVPEELHGRPVLGVIVCALVPSERGDEAVGSLRALGPVVDLVQPMPYTAVQQLLDPVNPWGTLNYWKAEHVRGLDDALVDALCAHGAAARSPLSILFLQPLGGAVARVPEDATAVSGRRAAWTVHAIGEWFDPADTEREKHWVRGFGRLVEPYRLDGVALTFTADTGDDRVRSTFGPEKYARLVALKDRYDPENLFRLNQNVKPSRS